MPPQPHHTTRDTGMSSATTESPKRIRDLLSRYLQQVFGEITPTPRRATINKLYVDDAVLYVSTGIVTGGMQSASTLGKRLSDR